MKDSKIEWIGCTPEDWNIKIIKNICRLKGRIGWQGLTADEYIDKGPYLITGINFMNGKIDWNSCEHVSEWRYNQAPEIQIEENDLLITKDGTVGKVALTQDTPDKVTLNSGVLLIRSLKNDYINKFLYYVLLSEEFWHWFEVVNSGNTTITHLYQNVFAKFKLTLPSLSEQKLITNFLDDKIGKVDSILSDLYKQIEVLSKYKKSLITEVVTKGLELNKKMKNSGVEWIENVPVNWSVEPIKYFAEFYNGDRGENYPLTSELVNDGIPFVNAGDIVNGIISYENMSYITEEKYKLMGGLKLKDNDMVYCLRGSVGKNALVHMNEGTVNSCMVGIRCKKKYNAQYFYYCMNSYIEENWRIIFSTGSVQEQMGAETIKGFKLPVPPIKEQEEIAEYLDEKCLKIEEIILDKQKQVKEIEKYKKSLIYEYVTGKKRVGGD